MKFEMIYEHANDLVTAATMVFAVAEKYAEIEVGMGSETALTYLAVMAFKAVDVSDGAKRGTECQFSADDVLFVHELVMDRTYDPDAPVRTKRAGLIADLWFETIGAMGKVPA